MVRSSSARIACWTVSLVIMFAAAPVLAQTETASDAPAFLSAPWYEDVTQPTPAPVAPTPRHTGVRAMIKGLQTLQENLDGHDVPVPTPQGYIRWERELDAEVRIIALPDGKDPQDDREDDRDHGEDAPGYAVFLEHRAEPRKDGRGSDAARLGFC